MGEEQWGARGAGAEWVGGCTAKYRLRSEWEGFFLFFFQEWGATCIKEECHTIKIHTRTHIHTHLQLDLQGLRLERGVGGDIAK